MMNKKRYFILSPSYNDETRIEELETKAMGYYGLKEYEQIMTDPIFLENIRNAVGNRENQNASLLLIGISTLAIAQCDSLYMAKDWEADDRCKFLHMLAFTHGIDIVYEPI